MSVSGGLGKRHGRRLLSATAVVVLAVGLGGVGTVSASASGKITFCHADMADGKPYGPKAKTTDPASILTEGHDGHTGSIYPGIAGKWGDIIPPFDYPGGRFVGLNYTGLGPALIANDCQLVDLKLKKIVDNVGGGTAVASDWTLKAAGPMTVSGRGLTDPTQWVTFNVLPGDYTLSESGGPSAYNGSWDCNDARLTSDTVTVKGDKVECTLTNTYAPPQRATLTLVKDVIGDDGAPLGVGAFTLTAAKDGGPKLSGKTDSGAVTTVEVVPGDYVLSESPDNAADYTALGWSCPNAESLDGSVLTLAAGNNVVCTITNKYTKPTGDMATLALVKKLGGDGPAAATAWTLSATRGDATPFSEAGGFSGKSVPAGAYTLSEAPTKAPGPAGYTAGAWSCTGGSLVGVVLTLAKGDVASCEITNTFERLGGGGGGGDTTTTITTPITTPVVTEVVTVHLAEVPTKVVKGAAVTEAPVVAPAKVTALAFTGAETLPLGLSGLLALLLGAGLILVSRRRTTE